MSVLTPLRKAPLNISFSLENAVSVEVFAFGVTNAELGENFTSIPQHFAIFCDSRFPIRIGTGRRIVELEFASLYYLSEGELQVAAVLKLSSRVIHGVGSDGGVLSLDVNLTS